MKIQIQKSDLISLLSKTQNIVEKRNAMPVLENILIEANEGKIKIFATDLEVSLTDQVSCKILEPGKLAINAKNIFNLVKELDEGLLTLQRKQNNWIEIKQNKSVFNVVGLPPDEYPLFPIYSTNQYVEIQASVLLEMIEKTIYSVSTDDTKYHLNGVFFEGVQAGGPNQYRMVATDGHRLSVVDRSAGKNEYSNSKGVIIPRKGLNEVRKILEVNKTEKIQFAIEGAQLVVRHNETLLMVRLIEGRYPNYQALIPSDLKLQAFAPKTNLVSSLRRVSLLSNQKSKGVTFSFSKGNLQISSNNPEMGDAKEEMEVQYNGDDIKIAFNAKYLLEALGTIEDDQVDINLKDQVSPVVIRPHGDSSYTCIIMPMRI